MEQINFDTCIYHSNCNDGFAAACVVKSKNPDVKFVPWNYDKGLPKEEEYLNKNVVIVDFSFKIPELKTLAQKTKQVVLIDHHKTFIESIAEDKNFLKEITNLKIYFNYKESGASLTWRYFYGRSLQEFTSDNQEHINLKLDDEPEIPRFIEIIKSYDLWLHGGEINSETGKINLALEMEEMKFEIWNSFNNIENYQKLLEKGSHYCDYVYPKVKKAAKKAATRYFKFTEKDGKVKILKMAFLNTTDYIGLIGSEILKTKDFDLALMYQIDSIDQKIYYSFRSTDEKYPADEVVKTLGGGGHRNACGFVRRIGEPIGLDFVSEKDLLLS